MMSVQRMTDADIDSGELRLASLTRLAFSPRVARGGRFRELRT
jgi:hypothetical protein